jgi:hypothetical protein
MRIDDVAISAQWSMKFAVSGLLALSLGCAGPQTYRYANHILIPPAVKRATLPKRTVALPITAKCAVSDGGIQFAPGKTIRVTVEPAKLVAHPSGWLQQWGDKLEEQGCLAAGTGFPLATRITEIVPIDPNAAFSLLRYPGLTYRDLGPEYRLFSAGPILREGAKPNAPAIVSTEAAGNGSGLNVTVKASPDLIGVETAWYAIQPNAGRDGMRIVFLSAEDRIGDQVSHPDKPRLDYLRFSDRAAYYRFFLHTAVSQSDHLAIVLAAATQEELRDQTNLLLSDPDVCAKAAASGMCVAAPFGSALSPALVAMVNGQEVAIRDRWTVRGALQASGVSRPEGVLPTLQVKRFYASKLVPVTFDHTQTDILDLPLSGREEIHW